MGAWLHIQYHVFSFKIKNISIHIPCLKRSLICVILMQAQAGPTGYSLYYFHASALQTSDEQNTKKSLKLQIHPNYQLTIKK